MCATPCSGNQPPLAQSGICIIPLQLFPSSSALDMQIPPFSLAAAIPLCRLVYLLLHFSDVFQGISFSPDALFHENMRETTLKSPRKLVSPVTSSSIPFWSSLSFIPPRARLPANLSWLWFDQESHVPISTAIYGLSDLGPLSLMAMQYIKQLTWAPHQCLSCVSFSVTVCYIAMKFRGKILTSARSVKHIAWKQQMSVTNFPFESF